MQIFQNFFHPPKMTTQVFQYFSKMSPIFFKTSLKFSRNFKKYLFLKIIISEFFQILTEFSESFTIVSLLFLKNYHKCFL